MIRRFDRNGNNMIDPDEAQGPAQFFLQRMAQNNPKIDLSKPVPIDLLTGEMDRMRGGRGDSEEEMATEGPSLMVPDFSLPSTPTPVPGFGASSSKFTVKVEERDIKEAEERLRRYDENRDGFLSADELRRGRWPDDPMQYDRNRDGKLSASELAVRYANQRIQEAARNANNNDRNSRGQRNDNGWVRSDGREQEQKEAESRFGDAKSYRLLTRKETVSSIKGLPDFFARSDADGDGQVLMSEFSSSWNEETLAEFLKWDLNNDGIITAKECLAAVANGARGATSSSSSSSGTSASAASAGSSQPAAGTPDAAQLEWAARQIAKYDTNGDKQLTANEWEKMIIKPDGADLNGDGAITVEEYAAFRARKK
jgi:Ca2+-binding EF-hand superfamily protein